MNESKVGKFLGIPYDWRTPTLARFKESMWNTNDERIITPRFFGWGYDINFYQLLRKTGIIKK